MRNPKNAFKAALQAGTQQIGIWNTIDGKTVVEQLASCGFDWMLVDTEHSPISVTDVMSALQAIAAYPDTSAVVRAAGNDTVEIKRLLDIGVQSLMIPYVQTADEARAAVSAMRYGPHGVRGFAGMTRATRFAKVENYVQTVEDELCLIVQVETISAIGQLEEIASVEGVDAVFIGPADLAASMGHPGNTGHPEVVAVIKDAIARLKAMGKPAGILSLDTAFNRQCIEWGTTFTAVGVDLCLLDDAVRALATSFGK
ncbi:HpcH/HpaI aldolase family protein [Flavimaricola marinus]|uniref:Hydroxypyruvate/pyruvate aldolase n=1 Tax=Flavimaricola marinus TaxID=1819565 RepID=A0A238LG63_9RHOB|nr:aldolase/citrate lyase family protein [Flavimaricola marinus]SMY08707.1 4-hydroxy-2-oxo-heptane-1,7-dioate aldolase [Flavimaricola marinus]